MLSALVPLYLGIIAYSTFGFLCSQRSIHLAFVNYQLDRDITAADAGRFFTRASTLCNSRYACESESLSARARVFQTFIKDWSNLHVFGNLESSFFLTATIKGTL